MIEATITERPPVWVLGIEERIDPPKADYGRIWGRYEQRDPEIQPFATDPGGYGVYFPCGVPHLVEFLAGMAVDPPASVPEGLRLREVPGGTYAVFECRMDGIGPAWSAIYGEWLPASGHLHDEDRPPFEYFPPGCHTGEAPVQIWEPVRPRV